MFCALLTSRYQVSVYRTNGPLVSRTDWNFQIKNRLKFYLMNRISNTDWNIYFKRSLKGLISRTTGSKLEVLF